MSSTLLQLVTQATQEMGLTVPTTVVGSTTTDTIQELGLINAVGNELARGYDWQFLVQQYLTQVSFTTVTATSTTGSSTLTAVSSTVGLDTTYGIAGLGLNQACYVTSVGANTLGLSQPAIANNTGATYTLTKVKYAMPSDWDRQIDRTHWDKSRHWEMLGPESAQQWEWLISGYISTGPRIRYRIFGNYFQIWPFIGVDDTIGFEYLSQNWVLASAATTPSKSSFTVDTDTCIFPDRLMVLGLKLKYFEIKGFDTTALYRDYTSQLDIAKSNDHGSPTLSMNPRLSSVLIGWENIPDSNYGT